jgi:hypothetical protein
VRAISSCESKTGRSAQTLASRVAWNRTGRLRVAVDALASAAIESHDMHKSLVKHRTHRIDPNGSDGYFLLIALISTFLISTLAIVVGLSFALMA